MDFISDAEMAKLSSAEDFISDEDMAKSAPDFISDHDMNVSKINPNLAGTLDEIMAAPLQGIQKAGAQVARLGAAAVGKGYEWMTGEKDETGDVVNKRIADITGVSGHREMHTIPGQAIETMATVLPLAANLPIAAVGLGGMYNDEVDALVAKGVSIDEARKVAVAKNAVMLGGGMAAGKAAMGVMGKFANPAVSKVVGGGAGFTGGVEAARVTQNEMLADRPELREEFDPTRAASNFLAGGGIAMAHPSVKLREPTLKEETPFGVAPEWDATSATMSKAEHEMLGKSRTLLEDKATKINEQIAEIEQIVGKTGEATVDNVDVLNHLEESLNKVASDLAEHDRIMSGDISKEVSVDKQLAVDIRKQEIVAALKERRQPTDKPFVTNEEAPPEGQKMSPMEVALTKIGEASKEPAERVAARLTEAQAKLERATTSSNKEALGHEITAYESILRGEKPDLTGFGKAPMIPVNREFPTIPELHSMLREAKNVGEALDTLVKADVGTKGQKALIHLLRRIPRALSAEFSIEPAFLQDKDGNFANGVYDTVGHRVLLHETGNVRALLHESVHAATVALLDQGTSKYAMELQSLFDLHKMADTTKQYGFTNVKEFISEAFTNSKFQAYLDGIASDRAVGKKPLSMWGKFKQIIKDAIGNDKETRSALDDILDSGANLMESAANKPEAFFQKLSEQRPNPQKLMSVNDIPTTKDVGNWVGRKFFGINAAEGFFRDHPIVQQSFKSMRTAMEQSDKITNSLWHGTEHVLKQGGLTFMDTLTKVKNKSSAIAVVMTTSAKDMNVIHDVFKQGFEQGKDYAQNLADNGSHLSTDQVNAYNTLATLFKGMYEKTVQTQRMLDKKHELPYRAGWYPAKRLGQYSVEVSFNGNNVHIETFKSRIDAEHFRTKIGTPKHLSVSDVLDASKKEERQPNKEMADIIGDMLEKKYQTAGPALKASIESLVNTMQTRGGKLGYHHQHRTNVPGYRGSELFRTGEQLGGSFKEGIQAEVNNFGMNLRSLMIKTKVEPTLSDEAFKTQDPVGHAAVQQMFDSTLGRNVDFFETATGISKTDYAIDKVVNGMMIKVLGKQFLGREGSATAKVNNIAMRTFYATKMMAKPIFVLSQLLTTPMIIPEMARDGHGLRAFYSFAKGSMKVLTANKELMDHIKEISQEYNVTEAQFLESMNLAKHTGTEGRLAKVTDFIEDYLLLGKVGKAADSMSRLFSYATAYTHYTDLGQKKAEASYNARLATDKAMNTYDSASTAPIFENLGFVGQGMKPLSSFGLNQLGNVVSYYKAAKTGDIAPLISYGLVATAMGGVLSLPFIQEYERFRQIAEKMYDITIPSILEIFSGDESFLDRLNITSQDAKDVALYGIPALTGIDISSSMRSNETMMSVMAAIALGQEDAVKLLPLVGATGSTVAAVPGVLNAMAGRGSGAAARQSVDALITGPIGYGAKELLGANTTRSLGKNTNMISTGKSGDADIPRTSTEIAAGILGGRSVAQRREDQRAFEMTARDKLRQQKVKGLTDMLAETGDTKYVKRLTDLGVTADQLESGVLSGVYNKNVGQYIRYFVSKEGRVDPQKANRIMNFGVK